MAMKILRTPDERFASLPDFDFPVANATLPNQITRFYVDRPAAT